MADSTDTKTEMKAAGDAVQGKADSAKAGIKADVVDKKTETEKWVTSKTGLKTLDTKIGTGSEAKMGVKVSMHYTVWLYENDGKGKKIDSSVDKKIPLNSTLGDGQMIKGYDEGIVGMKEGGKRTIIVPPDLGWGAKGMAGVIPPNATVIFEVEFVKALK